jgi:Cytochrome oxidase complex assembly protein 1
VSIPSSQAPKTKGWWGRNWVWVLPVGCLLPMLLCCGGVGVVMLALSSKVTTSEVYKQAVAQVTTNAIVQQHVGQPVTAGFGALGAIADADGDADFTFPVTGPKGAAFIHVVATRQGGKWTIQKLEAVLGGGVSVELLAKPAANTAKPAATAPKPAAKTPKPASKVSP